ncbi:MAG: hypothetical protein ACSLEL_00285 [Candidatus Malihini olakiniferum]
MLFSKIKNACSVVYPNAVAIALVRKAARKSITLPMPTATTLARFFKQNDQAHINTTDKLKEKI